MMSFTITPAFPSRGGTQGSGLSFAIGRVARRWGRLRREEMDSSGRKLNLSTCMPDFFLFCCPFGGFCPFPQFLGFLGHLMHSTFRHGIVGQRRARVKALDFELRLWN